MSHDVTASSDTSGAAGDAHAEGAQPSLAILLKRAEHAVRTRLQPALNEAGLLVEQWRILSVLADRPGLRMSEIGAAAVVPAATLTRHIDTLVERALVVRRIDPEDKRRVVSALSQRGAELAERLRAAEARIELALAEGLGSERYLRLRGELGLALHVLD